MSHAACGSKIADQGRRDACAPRYAWLAPMGLNHVREENRSPARAVLTALKQGLWFQYNLAELCAVLDELVRLSRFAQRQNTIDYGANLTSLDKLHRVEQLGL
jgi:hypothetical protein